MKHDYVTEIKSELLVAAEDILHLQISTKVRALVLELMIKGKTQKLKQETILYLTTRTLFSTFQTFSPEEIANRLEHLHSEKEKANL